jgi:NADPH:quinone reductase
MKAAYIETQGPPSVLQIGDLPMPEPKPGQLRVRVVAASVNPIDLYLRSGAVPLSGPTPFITGRDFAGVVDAVGPNVSRFQVGDRVWGANQGTPDRPGSFAEFCLCDEAYAYPIPEGVSDQDTVAAALVGITAHLGLFHRSNLKAGETVFVNGGTGGVGSMVVQMAKATGAKVITTVGSDEKARLASSLGADVVINYKNDDVDAAVKNATDGRGVEVWYETQPPTDLDRIVNLVAMNGRIVVMAGRAARPVFPNGPFYVKGLSLFGFAMFNIHPDIQRAAAMDINRWLEAKTIRPIIGETFPLEAAARAHQVQEENTLQKSGVLSGKIVVVV